MHQYWIEEGSFETEEQHLPCQVRSILKTLFIKYSIIIYIKG